MSRSRQPEGPQVRLSSVAWAAAYTWRDRVSEWGQILFASRGTLTVYTDEGLWVVPVHQAVWIPAGVRHAVEVAGGVALRSLHLLAEGEAVAEVANAVGYESTSAFVAAFRRALGTTPGRYFKNPG